MFVHHVYIVFLIFFVKTTYMTSIYIIIDIYLQISLSYCIENKKLG